MSVEFEPVKLGRRRRATDPVVVGFAVVAAAVVIAVIKPWEVPGPAATAVVSPVASAAVQASGREPEPSPASSEPQPPTWADVRPIVSRRDGWGIRGIALESTIEAPSGASSRYAERWIPVDVEGVADATAVLDTRDGAVVAMGVTFPRTEAPLAVRIWLDHGEDDLEWIAARPVNEVPGRGAYLFLRGAEAQKAVVAWEPGRYRVDVLVGDEIRRIGVEILDRFGVLPAPGAFVPVIPRAAVPLSTPDLEELPVGLFVSADGGQVPLPSTAGPALDETAAWLDLDRQATDLPPRAFVARTYQPRATRLGVVLPPTSTIRSATMDRLAPGAAAENRGEWTTEIGDGVPFVAFSTPRGAIWQPGVYGLTVEWVDGEGAHDQTWHVELLPGPILAVPALLSATRAWARLAGSSGVLMGWTQPIDGGSAGWPPGLDDMGPEPGTLHAIFHRSNALGCGDRVVPGGAAVVGFVGPAATDLAPVTSVMQFPLADVGPLPVLTAAGAVPGLAVVAPVLTAEFGGPAAYGFRAGSGPNAPGYTICVGMAAPTP